jgi:hypothetical protein
LVLGGREGGGGVEVGSQIRWSSAMREEVMRRGEEGKSS